MAGEPSNGYISRGNMTVILSAAGLVMIAFGGFITFQNTATNQRIEDVRDQVHDIQKTFLRKDEHEEFKAGLRREIEEIKSEVVPRPENETRWVAAEKNSQLLSDRLNELRNATTSTYTVRDEMIRLQAEMAELRKSVSDNRKQ